MRNYAYFFKFYLYPCALKIQLSNYVTYVKDGKTKGCRIPKFNFFISVNFFKTQIL